MQVAHHLHLHRVVAHRDKIVFRAHHIDAHPRIVFRVHARLHRFEAQQELRKHFFRSQVAQHLEEIPHLHLAGRRGLRRPAVLHLLPSGLGLARIVPIRLHLVAQSLVQQLLPELRECLRVCLTHLRAPSDRACDLRRMAEGRRIHQLQVLVVLCRGPVRHFVHPLGRVALVQAADPVKNGKELVVPAPPRRWHKAPHRNRVDQLVVEQLALPADVARKALCRHQPPRARRLGKTQRRRIDAQPILARVADQRLGINRARQVHMQVGAFGKVREKRAQCRRARLYRGVIGPFGVG